MFQQLKLGSVRCSIFQAKSLARFDQPRVDLEPNRAARDRLPSLQAPPDWWWVVVSSINAISEHVNYTVTKLQAKNLLISQQRQELDHLSATLSTSIVIESCNAGFDNNTHYIFGR